MDVEDEPNSYLKYLNDSDTPNTYLLGNNEVGLFSVEPIFSEMEAADWPQEGFPLLLTNSLITEDSTEDQDTNSHSSDKNFIEHTSNQSSSLKHSEESFQGSAENSTDSKTAQNIAIKDKMHLVDISQEPTENELQLNEELLLKSETQLDENCMELDDNCIQQLSDNELQHNDSVLQLTDNRADITEHEQPHDTAQIKPKEYVLVNGINDPSLTGIVKLVSTDKILTGTDSILKAVNFQNRELQKKSKTVNDLFSTVIANKCKICAYLCEDLEQIKRHIGEKHTEFLFTHNGVSGGVSLLLSNAKKKNVPCGEVNKEFTVFVCSECHGVCTDKNDLKQHMILVHHLIMEPAVAPIVVPVKARSSNKKMVLLNDANVSLVKKQEKAMQKVKCTVTGCIASFPTEDLCNSHAKLHVGDKKSLFRCAECEETFQMWRVARNHMYKEHGMDFGMMVCPMCSIFKSYLTARVLKHMMIHTEQKPYICQECGKAFKQLAQLKNHEVLHKTPEDVPSWSKVKKCDKCQGFFSNAKSLKSHIQSVHENFKPFICNICGHKTTRKAMLELHLRQHTGSKPHKCDYCEYKTGDPNCLRKHTMIHIGAKTYQCPHCPYRCIQSGSIKNHLQNKHQARGGTFSCKYCSYTTINPAFFNSHEKNHQISLAEGDKIENANAIEPERTRTNETDLQTDEETQSCFVIAESQGEETVDKGGITIPAGLEAQLVS